LTHDPHAMVRGAAAWALGRIASPLACAALRTAGNTEREESVRQEIVLALGEASGTTKAPLPLEHV
ncbi:MAG: HEAT repeat domain-containing protein, partial [Vulcanimicrobiaceae bacterium]